VITEPEELNFVTDQMSAAGLVSELAEVVQRPTSETELAGEEAQKVMLLIDALEDLDDVQDVFTNASFPEDMVFAS
jgi:transcriptional/translational regulatory protein YebC/TACO1